MGWRAGLSDDASPLTAEQRRAVESDARALEIRAGPGTGKTFTLAHRVARLAPRVPQQARVMVVAFTREATASLDRRLSILLGRDHAVRVGSFHQWAARELPREDRRFLAEGEGRRIVADAVSRAGAGLARALGVAPGSGDDVATRVLGFLSYLKNAETSLERALATTHATLSPWEEVLRHAQDVYETRKGDRLDYDDLLLSFRDRLRRSAAYRQQVAGRWDHVLVDEYQDVNGVQAETVRLVALAGPRVTVVGDARQSIYAFRGGSPRHLETFLDAFPKRDGERVALTRSFRATRALIHAANAVLSDLHPLRAAPRAAAGVPPVLGPREDAADEARWACDHLERLLAEGAAPEDVAVLVRARHHAAAWQDEALQRRADEAWAHANPGFLDAAVEAYLHAARRVDPRPPPRVLLARLAEDAAGPAQRALRLLERRARAAPKIPARPTARDLLALPTGEGLARVTLHTIHAAKGLEWDHVLLLGAREGGLPNDHALAAPPGPAQDEMLAEEKRLLYVALTRARKTFTATWPDKADRRGRGMSRFLTPLTAQRTT